MREIFHITTDDIDPLQEPVRREGEITPFPLKRRDGKPIGGVPVPMVDFDTFMASTTKGFKEGYVKAISDAQLVCEQVCKDCIDDTDDSPGSPSASARMCTVKIGQLLKDRE